MSFDPEMLMQERDSKRKRLLWAGPHRFTNESGACMIRGDSVTAVFHDMAGPALVTCIVAGGVVVRVNEPMDDVVRMLGWR